jgi:hypothetical protein
MLREGAILLGRSGDGLGEGHNYIGGPSNPGHVIFRRL